MASDTTYYTVSGRPRPAPRKNKRYSGGSAVVYLCSVVLIALCMGPVLYIMVGGLKSNSEFTTAPAAFPSNPRWYQYGEVFQNPDFWRQFTNSTIIAVATTVGVVALGTMAGFAVARYPFKGAAGMYSLFAAGLMFPLTVAVTPLYLLVQFIGLLGDLPGVILPQIAFQLPMTIVILVPFLRAIPYELEEAAAIDGCGRLGFFFRMVVPLAVPGMITVGILAFVTSWNGYMLPLFILSSPDDYTLPLGVAAYATEHSVDTARVLAFTSISMLPSLIFFSIFERRIVGGLSGAVKG
ncbi:MAG: carbohydrate ABC transporter permease [Bifidobacteriaceae bacterium]|jgi:raffinose/stachyose/melibiose transport system permease protein|nr:carbohydrate ABC transporter permease [Bifidobacteriaceae bacterium]